MNKYFEVEIAAALYLTDKKAVERAMEIDDFQLKQMRISSRKTSEEQLDYRLYSQGLVKYLRLKRKK
ncbi:MAG: hypothetical protein EOM74_05420 [Methanomicrobia archaeon]|nr:hypothetical protein [Methanomicrobia archaeon]